MIIPLSARALGGSIFGALKLVPRWLWILLAVALASRFAANWHAGKVEALDRAAYGRGVTDTVAAAARLQAERARLDAAIAAELRSKNDEESRRIAAAAERLRLRGPGKAACPDPARLPGGAGRHGAPGGAADAAGPDLPADQRAAVPWPWLVDRAESHDALRAEVLNWREWHRRFTEEWERSRASAPPR